MNESSSHEPEIDLYSLHLLRQVARFRGFTAASEACGLSQSALTRQVQAIEAKLGIRVFERTTRAVTITEAGAVLLRETEAIPNILSGAMRRIREDYLGEKREIRIGISRDLSLAHIPGIFHAQKKLQPEVRLVVCQPDTASLIRQTENAQLDLSILTKPLDLPATVGITHRMADRFSIIAPATGKPPADATPASFRKWTAAQGWLLPPAGHPVRDLIDTWARKQKAELRPVMELENFDIMVQLASMGMGTALVPRRSLSGFQRKKLLQVVTSPLDLERQLVVICPMHSRCPEHVERFVRAILFS